MTLIHGENGFKPVAKAPKGKVTRHRAFIAGHSETGHHHIVQSKTEFDVIEALKGIYIQLFEPAEVKHKKTFDIHETKTLEPGIYQITHKTEYNPFTKLIEKVWD